MLVGERMSRPVISVTPDDPINDVLAMFKKEHIRRAPVLKGSKLVGIISERDLLNASPSKATTLSIWELHYLISKVQVKSVMSKDVLTVSTDTPIEDAARIMAESKIGGLPVVDAGHVVGMITETDLFKVFLELMGARDKGIRVTATVDDKPGELAKVTKAIAGAGGDFVSFGCFSGEAGGSRILTFKVGGLGKEAVTKALEGAVTEIRDIR